MEEVYFYSDEKSKKVNKLLEDDYFKRLGYIVRECKLLGSDRKGYFLYIKAESNAIEKAEEMLKEVEVEKILGEEKEVVVKVILEEEESAAAGMGAIFG